MRQRRSTSRHRYNKSVQVQSPEVRFVDRRRPAVPRLLGCCLVLTVLATGVVRAEESRAPRGGVCRRRRTSATSGGSFGTGGVGPGSVDRSRIPQPFLVIAPSIGSKPSTGLTRGFSGNMAFFRGDPETTHISSISGGFKLSQKKQTLGGLKFAMFTQDDRWFIQGDARLSLTSQNTYDLGTQTPAGQRRERRLHAAPAVRNGVSQGRAEPVCRGRPERQRPLEHPSQRGRSADLGSIGVRHLYPEARLRAGRPDLRRDQRGAVVRHARQRDQRAARFAGQRDVSHLLRRFSGRRFVVAGALPRSADLPEAVAQRTTETGVLVSGGSS